MPYSDGFNQELYKRNLVLAAVNGLPDEATLYGVFTEFVMSHKVPSERFILAPQLNLRWNPADRHSKDRRKEIPDFGIGHFTLPGQPGENPPFKLRCGAEAKRPIRQMASLPTPDSLIHNAGVRSAFHALYFQVMDQAKAAYKNQYPLCEDGFYCILLVGPYWTVEKFGPFTEAEMSVRAMKPSDSGDHEETAQLLNSMDKTRKLHRENTTSLASDKIRIKK
jgi:hypothetical protein